MSSKYPISKKKAERNENKLIGTLDILKHCKEEIKQWGRLLKDKNLATDLKLQKQVALIARGIYIKMQTIDAMTWWTTGEKESFLQAIKSMAKQYEDLFKSQSVNISLSDQEGNPMAPIINLVSFKDLKMNAPGHDSE